MAESGQVLAAALAQEGLASGAGVGQVLAAGVLEVTLEVSAAGAAGRPPQAWRTALGLMLEKSIGKRGRSRQWQHELLPCQRCLQGKFQAKPEGNAARTLWWAVHGTGHLCPGPVILSLLLSPCFGNNRVSAIDGLLSL